MVGSSNDIPFDSIKFHFQDLKHYRLLFLPSASELPSSPTLPHVHPPVEARLPAWCVCAHLFQSAALLPFPPLSLPLVSGVGGKGPFPLKGFCMVMFSFLAELLLLGFSVRLFVT